MATGDRETCGFTVNAFYSMNTAADETSQRDRSFNAETLCPAGELDLAKEPLVTNPPYDQDRPVLRRFARLGSSLSRDA